MPQPAVKIQILKHQSCELINGNEAKQQKRKKNMKKGKSKLAKLDKSNFNDSFPIMSCF